MNDPRALPPNAVAIIGMAGRFPGANTPAELWQLVRDGREAIRRLSDAELRAAGVAPSLIANPAYVRAAATLDRMDEFDAGFFGFSPRDAAIMDPQHRHFLETAWEALESAGYTPEGFAGSIGVFGGCGAQAYFARNLLNNPQLMTSAGYFLVRHTGNDKDFLTTRVSYQLNLRGPSVSVQTACSTSLVAVHLASQSLLNRECDMALAGGVTIEIPHGQGYLYDEGEILSPDGHCRAFDAESKGTVFGSGAGLVVLRRLEDAIDAGDHIHAVIIGSAVNNDGAGKVGYLAPSVDGQAAVVAEAIALAGVDAASISYIETHGTGTPVGDPIEIAALTEAFGPSVPAGSCAIGSIKTNIGHLDTAAGVASLIKAASAVEHAELPPSLHFRTPNPTIPFDETPFRVNSQLRPWTTEGPRRAGITSLGVGGTNAHVVIEEAPAREASTEPAGHRLLVLSARSSAALDRAAARLASHLDAHRDLSLADAAFTLHAGRRAFTHRLAVSADTIDDAIRALSAPGDEPLRRRAQASAEAPPITFMFPGGGAQHPGMAADLYAAHATFRADVDRCLASAAAHAPADLRPLVLPPPGSDLAAAAQALERPSLALPALFTTEYALARLLQSWGIVADSHVGHSLGEYVAACLSGVMSLDDALAVVSARGRLFEQLPPGMMMSVPVAAATLAAELPEDLSIAADNGPALSVVSGPADSVQRLADVLAARGIESQRLRIAVAAHSRMLEPILPEFHAVMRSVKLAAPVVPFVSNVTGTWITEAEATSPDYWVRHLRSTVRFAAAVTTLTADAKRVFVEVGPGMALTSMVRLQAAAERAIPTLGRAADARLAGGSVLAAVGQLWAQGAVVDAARLHDAPQRRRVPLPTYPFEHERYWIEPSFHVDARQTEDANARDVSRWLQVPVWARTEAPAAGIAAAGTHWLLLADTADDVAALAAEIARIGGTVAVASPGLAFTDVGGHRYTVVPSSSSDHDALLSTLDAAGRFPTHVLVTWQLTGGAVEDGFFALFALARALAESGSTNALRLAVITRGLHQVQDERPAAPEQARAAAAAGVVGAELAHVSVTAIDLDAGDTALFHSERIIAELLAPTATPSVAWRESNRWTPAYRALRPAVDPLPVRDGGVYVLTGGLGGIALTLAEAIARAARVTLVLVSRRGLPPRDEWDRLAADDGAGTIARVRHLETLGATVVPARADVTRPDELRVLVADLIARHGRISGVVHAAGVLADNLIAVKTVDEARRVLDPKVRGTLALADALEGQVLDFWVNCSSVSSMVHLPGQIDYAAANAFLDAFSRHRHARDGRTVAVNWEAWRGVGMLGDGTRATGDAPASWQTVDDGLLEARRSDGPRELFRPVLSPATHWVLDEHRLSGGDAILPGTALLELAVEAARQTTSSRTVEVDELLFLEPFRGDQTPVELRVAIDRTSGDLVMSSGPVDAPIEHVRGTVSASSRPRPERLDLESLLARCPETMTPATPNLSHLRVGTHWQCAASVRRGTREALAKIALPAALRGEVDQFTVHPSLLDVATACSLWSADAYAPERDFFVPLSYGRVTVHAPLTAEIWCHARQAADAGTLPDVAVFDLTVTDDAGGVLLQIERFVLRRLAPIATLGTPASRATATRLDLADAIVPSEGAAAFFHVLRSLPLAQVLVGPHSIDQLTDAAARIAAGAGQVAAASRGRRTGALVAPSDDVERAIADIWTDLLGIGEVSIDDDFFELGGHSLLLAQAGSRIRRALGTPVPVAQLFEHPTIRSTAAFCRAATGGDDEPALVSIPRDRMRRSKASLAGRAE